MQDLYQRLGLDPFAITDDADPMFGFLPDRRQQLKQGLAIGGDVAVPLAQYIARLAGTDLHNALKEDIRVRPDGMTLREAREFQEHYAAALAKRGGELRAAAAAAAEKSQSALAVFGDALAKLQAVGSALDAAGQEAVLISAYYDAFGALLKADALTEYRRANIDFQQILPEQLSRDTAEPPSVAGVKGYEQRGEGKLRGSKKSFSSVNSPILSCNVFTSTAGSCRTPSGPNTAAAPARNRLFQSVIWLGCTSKNCASSASVFSPLKAASATFALNAAEWSRLVRLLIISPDPRYPCRMQAETPLSRLSRFSRPPLQAPEVVENEARKAASRVVSSLIEDRLVRNDPSAVRFYRQYQDRLDPKDRAALGAAVEMLSNSIDAAAWVRDRSANLPAPQGRAPTPTGDSALDAVNAASISTAEPPPIASSAGTLLDREGVAGYRQRLDEIEERRRALTALNEQEFAANPARLRANRTAIETDSARGRAVVKAEADGLYADLLRHLTTGGPGGGRAVTPPPATLLSRFTVEQQASIARQVDRTIEGRPPATDSQTGYAIRQALTSDDATERQRWASTNLVQFMDRLSEEDYAALAKLQTVVRTDDGGAESTRLQIINRMANEALRTAGIDPTPRPGAAPDSDAAQAARFHRALQGNLSAVESTGRKPTEVEAYGIVKGLKDTAIKSGWLKVSDRPASPTEDSDIPETDDAFHKDGVPLAQAGPPTRPAQNEFRIIGLAEDFETFHRQMEEERQREADEQAAAGTGGAPGAPATEPYPGSPEYETADAEARAIVAQQEAEELGGQGGPQTEPPPGSSEHLAAEAEARKLDEDAWTNLGFFGQLGIAFESFDAESKKSGAALDIDSKARRQEKVLELQQKARETPDKLTLVEKQYLLRNRNAAPNLAGAVARLIDAQRRLDDLPSSDPLRRLSEASTAAEAGKLLRDHPGEIARAIGLESLPSLTISLIATAALGPIGGAVALTGTSGLEGYAQGLIGALVRAGVDVSDADELIRALQDNALMERVRKDATTDGAIAGGVNAAMMMFPVRWRPKRASISLAMKVPALNAKGRGFDSFRDFKNEIGHAPKGYAWHHIVEQSTTNIEKFGAENIHNTNNLVLLPDGRGTIHSELSALYSSIEDFSRPLTVRKWLAPKSFEEQATYGREFIEQRRKVKK